MLNYLRQSIRAWLGLADSQPVQDAPPARQGLAIDPGVIRAADVREAGVSLAESLLRRAGEVVIHRDFGPPVLPPGVVPDSPGEGYMALDSEFVAPVYAYANQFQCGLGFPGYAYLAELSQRSEYRSPSETIASEMTREFFKVIVKGEGHTSNGGEDVDGDGDVDKQDKIARITEAIEKFKVREALGKVAELDGLFGRAQIYIDLDYGSREKNEIDQLPLLVDKATIKPGSLKAFKVIEPIWTTPFVYNATDPTAPDFYVPKAWFVLGRRIHHTRLLTFVMRPVPDILKPAYNFGGLSMTQLMESSVFRWLRTVNSVSDLIHNFSVMCLQTDMTNILSGEPDHPGGLLDRAKLFTSTRDNQGVTLLDKDKEELVAVNVPLSGLDKLQAQSQEHMAAPSHIPLVKLFGVTPSGLNASSEGEIKVFYDFVRACQQKFYNDNLNIILQILQLHLFGEIDDAISFEWISLSAPTVKELSEIRKANAETDAVYIDKGVVSPEEVREKVNSDPESGYNNLTGDAPTPPDMAAMEQQHLFTQEGEKATHERETAAEAK